MTILQRGVGGRDRRGGGDRRILTKNQNPGFFLERGGGGRGEEGARRKEWQRPVRK